MTGARKNDLPWKRSLCARKISHEGVLVGGDKGSGRCVFRVKEVVCWVLPSLVYGGLHTLHALYPAALV